MSTTERRDHLLRLLRQRADWLVDDLARETAASRRTVLRDLNHLRMRGFDIVGLAGPGGGVRLEATSVLVTSQLDADEVVALTLAVEVASATSHTPFAAAADRALGKIEAALPARRAEELRLFRQRIVVSHTTPMMRPEHRPIDDQLIGVFEAGFSSRQLITFDYVDRKKSSTNRSVEPQGLLVRPPVWYVLGWDRSRDDFRTFRADRISKPSLTDATFTLRMLPDDWKYNPSGWPNARG